MTKYIVANNLNRGDDFAIVFVVDVGDDSLDVLSAMRDASAEFIATPAGQEHMELNGDNFNYGDFAVTVPEEICLRHGFRVVDSVVTNLLVDHDDLLAGPE